MTTDDFIDKVPLDPGYVHNKTAGLIIEEAEGYALFQDSQQALIQAYTEITANEDVSPEQRSLAAEVLRYGTYRSKEFGFREALRNGQDAVDERMWFAKLIQSNPRVAEILVGRNVAGFHATGSPALAGLVQDGKMLSGSMLEEMGRGSVTGEHKSHPNGQSGLSFGLMSKIELLVRQYGIIKRQLSDEEVISELEATIQEGERNLQSDDLIPGERDFIASSTKSLRRVLEDFKAQPKSLMATMMRFQFPAVFGIDRDFARDSERNRLEGNMKQSQSYYGEFKLAVNEASIDAMAVVAVPGEYVGAVQKIMSDFQHASVEIIPLESLLM